MSRHWSLSAASISSELNEVLHKCISYGLQQGRSQEFAIGENKQESGRRPPAGSTGRAPVRVWVLGTSPPEAGDIIMHHVDFVNRRRPIYEYQMSKMQEYFCRISVNYRSRKNFQTMTRDIHSCSPWLRCWSAVLT